MKKVFLIVLILSAGLLSAQTKYLIYFKDKGIDSQNRLNKSSLLFKAAEKELTQRSIERRKKVMGEENYITFEDLPLNDSYVEQIESNGIKIVNKLKWFNAVSCYLTVEEFNLIKQLPFVKKIEQVGKFISRKPIEDNKQVPDGSSSRLYKTNYNLDYGPSLTQNELSEIPVVHDLGINGSGVLIGLLDTGFRWQSTESVETRTVIAERDFIQGDNVTGNQAGDASGQDSHGTNVFSIIGGYAPGSLIGPAYGASFLLAKTEYVPTETHVEEDNYAAALEWMEGLGVDITSSSLGYSIFDNTTYSYTYEDMNGNTTIVAQAANLAFDRGIITLTAAGNEGSYWGVDKGGISSPGDAFNIITVGAVDASNNITAFSSRGPTSDGRIKPELVALGNGVYHSDVGTSFYSFGAGTSYATPITAGVAALLKSAFPHLTNQQVRRIMIESGDNLTTPNNEKGYGLISAKRAVTYPNLEKIGNEYKLRKIFIDDRGVDSSTVMMSIHIPSYFAWDPVIVPLSYDGSSRYSYTFSNLPSGHQIELVFSYVTKTGVAVNEPSPGTYKFYWGDLIISDVANEDSEEIPTQFKLYQNYPNPFNPSTTISYAIPDVETTRRVVFTTLKVYDILGKEVATLVNQFQQPGTYSVQFDVETLRATSLPSGVYFYTLRVGDSSPDKSGSEFMETKKMVLIK
ncbi:MAG: S8 family serine peptidase [Bacteroidota bacterium]